MELDIRKLIEVISNSQLITKEPSKRGLINFATGALVEPEITHDLLNAYTMSKKKILRLLCSTISLNQVS